MKLHRNSESIGKLQKRRKATKVASLLLVIFSLTIIFIYFPSFPYNLQQSSFDSPILSSTTASPAAAEQQSSLIPDELCPLQVDGSHLCNSKKVDAGESAAGEKENPTEQNDTILEEERKPINNDTCDLFNGEWVPNPEAPYYYRTENDPCWAIQEHQNCFKYGRPDRDYLKWRWKPDGCELPIFDPIRFFELVRGKSLAFVGDSLARNHMQSLICLLSVIAYPEDISAVMNTENKRYIYRDKNFTISMFWSPYLVKSEIVVGSGRPFKLYLDEFDENWRTQIANFNYVIISAGPWFNRPTYFHENGKIVGCHFCPSSENVTVLTSQYSYKRAFRTAFKAINSLVKDFKGVIFLRTFSPSHFEGGAWDNGGKCNRTRPFLRNETTIAEYAQELYEIQLKELEIAKTEGRRKGVKFRLFDATKSMWLRPDGHPGRYGHPPQLKVELPEDCVHWCLPGPIDSMNDVLLQLLKREEGIHSQ